jgi:N,N-dimethylformamidase
VDRYDLSLGTPPNARVLAMSEPFSDNYPLAHEDIAITTPGLGGTQNHNVRADMVYFKTKNEGAVFSASSIAWVGSLPCNDFDNSVSRITKNVIDRFLQPGPLPSN